MVFLNKYLCVSKKIWFIEKQFIYLCSEKINDMKKVFNLGVGNTIKMNRKFGMQIKEKYGLTFFPRIVDVVGLVDLDKTDINLVIKLTKENGKVCRCCGATLKTPMSQVGGIGPVCSKGLGLKFPTTKDQIESFKQNVEDKINSLGEFELTVPKRQIEKWEGNASVLLNIKV